MAILKTANTKGKYYESHAKDDVIQYILNPSKAKNYCEAYGVDMNAPAESMKTVSAQFGKSQGVQLRHFIISFYPDELNDPAIANEIAKQFMVFFAHDYQTIYAVHQDKLHLHTHIIINSVSYVDGHRYYGTRAEFKAMQHYMKKVLEKYNIHTLEYVSAS